jgi:hypothetical protein
VVSWFAAAGMDVALLPPAASPADAFRFAADRHRTYDVGGVQYDLTSHETLSDERRIVREVVCTYSLGGRERRTKMAELIYIQPRHRRSGNVWGSERWQHRISGVAAPPATEHRAQVEAFVEDFSAAYVAHDRAVPVDAVRRAFYVTLSRCDAVLMRQAGGIYFVAQAHARHVESMRLVTGELGLPSHFATVPVPETPEQQVTVDLALAAEVQRLATRLRSPHFLGQRDLGVEAGRLLGRLERHLDLLPHSDVSQALATVEQLLAATKSD